MDIYLETTIEEAIRENEKLSVDDRERNIDYLDNFGGLDFLKGKTTITMEEIAKNTPYAHAQKLAYVINDLTGKQSIKFHSTKNFNSQGFREQFFMCGGKRFDC
jgi:hypothetical protein